MGKPSNGKMLESLEDSKKALDGLSKATLANRTFCNDGDVLYLRCAIQVWLLSTSV